MSLPSKLEEEKVLGKDLGLQGMPTMWLLGFPYPSIDNNLWWGMPYKIH